LLEGDAGLHATWVGRISVRDPTTRECRSFEESEITLFRRTSVVHVRHPGAVSGGDSMTGSIKSPRARNPAARATGRLLDHACFAVLSRKLRYESSSSHLCKCSSKLLAPISHFLFYLPAITPPSKHDRPPDEVGEEDLERPVRRHRTSAPDVDAVSVDGPVMVLTDQVVEHGRRRDSWDRVKRRLRSAFDLLRALFFVEGLNVEQCHADLSDKRQERL
jgi:hypothetical protein